MADDIVTRLRAFIAVPQIGRPDMEVMGIPVCLEAANEIERLRGKLWDAYCAANRLAVDSDELKRFLDG